MANLQSGIYRIQNVITGDFYVGSTRNIQKRWWGHLSSLRLNKHHNARLQNAFNKYGENCFIFGIVEECSVDLCLAREEHHFNMWNPAYNIERTPGRPTLGRTLSRSTKQKISKANSVNRMTPEHFKKFRDAITVLGSPMKGKKHNESSKKQMSESRKKFLQKLIDANLPLPGPKLGSKWSQARRAAQLRKIR